MWKRKKEKDLWLCESQSIQRGQCQRAAVRKSNHVKQYRKRSTDPLWNSQLYMAWEKLSSRGLSGFSKYVACKEGRKEQYLNDWISIKYALQGNSEKNPTGIEVEGGEGGRRENNIHNYTIQIWMYIKCRKDCWEEKRMNLFSGSIVDRFKTQQERLENKNDKGREAWPAGCPASSLRLFKES